MDEASHQHAPNEHTAPLTSLLARNNDALTVRLRSEAPVVIDELVRLHRAASPPATVAVNPSSDTRIIVSSSRKVSSATKPTSVGTSYPAEGYTGRVKATVTYASSLSATQGSTSKTEADMDAIRDSVLAGVGNWMAEGSIAAPPLGVSADHRPVDRQTKLKKPTVVIHQEDVGGASSNGERPDDTKSEGHGNSRADITLRHRYSKLMNKDPLHLAEQGCLPGATLVSPAKAPLSRTRTCILVILVIVMVLILGLSAFAAHHTGKMRMACTKRIIFATTIVLSFCTVLAMVVARRVLQEALLAALFMFLVGFGFVLEIHDLM